MDPPSTSFLFFCESLLSPGEQNYRVCLTPSSMSDNSSTNKAVLTCKGKVATIWKQNSKTGPLVLKLGKPINSFTYLLLDKNWISLWYQRKTESGEKRKFPHRQLEWHCEHHLLLCDLSSYFLESNRLWSWLPKSSRTQESSLCPHRKHCMSQENTQVIVVTWAGQPPPRMRQQIQADGNASSHPVILISCTGCHW